MFQRGQMLISDITYLSAFQVKTEEAWANSQEEGKKKTSAMLTAGSSQQVSTGTGKQCTHGSMAHNMGHFTLLRTNLASCINYR